MSVATVATLTVGTDNIVTQDAQLGGAVVITGTLTGMLAAGGGVDILLPNGQIRQAVLGSDGISFSLEVTAAADLAAFAVPNSVSAYVAGAPGAEISQAFTAAAQRSLQPITANPAAPAASTTAAIAISGDASTVAFVSLGTYSNGSTPASLYIEQLATGTITLVTDAASTNFGTGVAVPSLSEDGHLLAYAENDGSGGSDFILKDFDTGTTTTLATAYYGGNPSLADDGTVVFQGEMGSATVQQIYAAHVSGGTVTLSVVSAPDPAAGGTETMGDGNSDEANISADGSMAVFRSAALDLLAPGDPNAGALTGSYQIYAKALRDNAATGLQAGQVVLVSLGTDNSVSSGSDTNPVISGDGRYVVFENSADGETYVRDIATGTTTLVSCAADGTPADAATRDATISADGRTVVFRSAAFNLLDPTDPAYPTLRGATELYEKDLVSGKVTLLSEAGYIEGDNTSSNPALSADGSKVAFLSYADNLASGLGPDTNVTTGSAAELGFVTSVVTTAVLTFGPPLITSGTDHAQLSGTIDTADAGRGIRLTDPGDPGFSVGPVSLSATSDPYIEDWTASAFFSESGTQTVTAGLSLGPGAPVSESRTFSLSFTPGITIHPPGVKEVLDTSLLSSATTTLSGTAVNEAGQTLSLALMLAGGNKVSLGHTTIGSDGAWALAVTDRDLAHLGAGDDALVASVAGGSAVASQAVSLTVDPTSTLYTFRFTYTDGSFYTGTVAGGGSYVYAPGQSIATSGGKYTILAAAGATAQAAGTVTTEQYYDVTSDAYDVPALTAGGMADGSAGLGSESDSISGPLGVQAFSDGVTEAKEASSTLYDFAYVYNNGSVYTGTVAGGGTYDYTANETIATSAGYYKILGSIGASTDAPGTVHTSLYYDTATAQTYVPMLAASGTAAGISGLGSESDILSAPSGTSKFGLAGTIEARYLFTTEYNFKFTYNDGSYYDGTVIDNGTYNYTVGEKIKTSAGQYDIFAAAPDPDGTAGDVNVTKYFDVSTQEFYDPYDFPAGSAFGHKGLQSEYGQIGTTVAEGFGWYPGSDGKPVSAEARQASNTEFQFSFTYKDGSYYIGEVVDNGQVFDGDGYSVGDAFGNANGYYTILKNLGPSTDTSGNVYVDKYHDVSTNADYTPQGHNKGPDGSAGLGSENDSTDGPQGTQSFGDEGLYEAKQSAQTVYDFQFTYKDGSHYIGTVVGDASNHYKAGLIIKTAYGFYTITGSQSSTMNNQNGEVDLEEYFDSGSQVEEKPVPTLDVNDKGLGSELGEFENVEFGQGGALEAKLSNYQAFQFTFRYTDGSYYTGTVSDAGGSYGYHVGQQILTGYGVYTIDGIATDHLKDPAGEVYVNDYFDANTEQSYTPLEYNLGGPDGDYGLGSELDVIKYGAGSTFGKGGAYEALTNPATEYDFTFTYLDGAKYFGIVAAPAGTYTPGKAIVTQYGEYTINDVKPITGLQNGDVVISDYRSADGTDYTPVRYYEDKPSGVGGFGSEVDFIRAPGGILSAFGRAGQNEADVTPKNVFALSTFPALAAFDGPIAGATVGYLDGSAPPGTLAIDPDQPSATTQSDGSYSLAQGVGPLVLTGGTDTYTGLAFHGIMSSAGQTPVISPITTLIEAVAEAKGDTTLNGIAAANALVLSALGLPSGLDLTSYMPVQILNDPASSPTDIASAEAVYRAGAALLDAETLIDAAGGSSRTALVQVADSLADGSLTDLTDFSALIEHGALMPDAASAVTTIFAATQTYLGEQLDGMTVPNEILKRISGASIATQGGASAALAAANGDYGSVATAYLQNMATTLQTDDAEALTSEVACYCLGTEILTEQGPVRVESLRIGDRVRTQHAGYQRIKWIGQRGYHGRFIAGNRAALPICIRRDAIAENVPCRDLWISPGHAIAIDGALIHASRLVNGVSIVQAQAVESVTYFHIELENHEIIFAENCPAESFMAEQFRAQFQNAEEYAQRYPGERAPRTPCQEVLASGFRLHAIQTRLNRRAGLTRRVAGGPLRGFVDQADRGLGQGWAQDIAAPAEPVCLDVIAGGRRMARMLANLQRDDIRQAGLGNGYQGFTVALRTVPDAEITVRRASDQAVLTMTQAASDASASGKILRAARF